jgi:bifunctional ADP-heptose synthase (sugar kinase/adenylyltransferase)
LGVFVTDKSKYHKIPAQIRDIADVSGAGDTVISVATCCLAAKLDIDIVAAISNIAGGLVCEKIGVVPIEKELLLQESVSFFEK